MNGAAVTGRTAGNGHLLIGMHEFELAAPISVLVELTRSCNLRCLHCFSNAGDTNLVSELGTSQWKRFIDKLAEMRVFLIFFGGGEPLCREDFFIIANHAKKRGIDACLLSNLTLIDRRTARRLKRAGIFKVEGNLDGHDAKTYESLRRMPGSFRKTVEGIRNCQEAGIPVRINCTLTRLNYRCIEEIVEYAIGIGITEVAFLRLIPSGRGDANFRKLDFGERVYRKEVLPKLRSLRQRHIGRINLGYEQDEDALAANDPNMALPWCGSGRIHCTVTAEGLVKPDPYFPNDDPRIVAGNILDEDFAEIWRRSPVFLKIRRTSFPQCIGCRHVACVGGDVYRIYHHYGEIMGGRDPRCLEGKAGTDG